MTACAHSHLVLVTAQNNRVRCRHCHLTISSDELMRRFCPECYEIGGKKRYDFDPVEDPDQGKTRYRCEDCGVLIDCD